jgi:hypothetical protein
MSKTTRKKSKFKNDLIYSNGVLPVEEKKTPKRRICLSFGRENVQGEVPGAQPAAAAPSAGQPKKKSRASLNALYFSDFSCALLY